MAGHGTKKEDVIGALKRLLHNWGPILALVGGVVGLWYENRYAVLSIQEVLHRLREDVDSHWRECVDRRAFGPDGFVNPEVRAALELHLRRMLAEERRQRALEDGRWRRSLFQLNPNLQKPSE